jgi:hypothetical protein
MDERHGAFGGIRIGKETQEIRENLPQCHFVHYKPRMTLPDINLDPRGEKLAINRRSRHERYALLK